MLLWPKTANVRFYIVKVFPGTIKKDLFRSGLNINFAMKKSIYFL